MTTDNLDDFVEHYLVAALWSSTDGDGEPLDSNYGPEDLAPETLAAAIADCERVRAMKDGGTYAVYLLHGGAYVFSGSARLGRAKATPFNVWRAYRG